MDKDFNLDFLEEFEEDGHAYYLPELIEIDTFEEFEEILNSEEFEVYVRLLAESNPFYVRNGFALQGPNFLRNLLKCTKAAKMTFDAQLEYEGHTFEEYKAAHYSECMISRDSCFREMKMPNELVAPDKKVLEKLVGTLTDANVRQYERQTKEMQDDEIYEWIKNYRNLPNIIGLKNLFNTSFFPYAN